MSITIYLVTADKYHAPPYRFFSPLIDALFDDGPNQGKSIKLMKILKPIANPLCQGLNDFAKYYFDPSITNWSV